MVKAVVLYRVGRGPSLQTWTTTPRRDAHEDIDRYYSSLVDVVTSLEEPEGVIQLRRKGQAYSHLDRVPIGQLARPRAESVRDAPALAARCDPLVVEAAEMV